jgi:hypothetical protein
MNGAFVHLAVNHVPVVGVPIGVLLLLAGLARKSRDLVQAGFAVMALMALVTIVAFKSGGPAARVVRNIPGITRGDIHAHAEAADNVFVAMEILGAAALLALGLSTRPNGSPKLLTALIVLGSLFVSCWFSWVAHLGGLIRHPEVASGFQPPAPPAPPAEEE